MAAPSQLALWLVQLPHLRRLQLSGCLLAERTGYEWLIPTTGLPTSLTKVRLLLWPPLPSHVNLSGAGVVILGFPLSRGCCKLGEGSSETGTAVSGTGRSGVVTACALLLLLVLLVLLTLTQFSITAR